MSSRTRKSNLIVVRAGQNSLHPGWLNLPYAQRDFDLVVSYFNETAYENHQEEAGVTPLLIKGGKWDGLYKSFQEIPDYKDYTYIWLPDDDIDTRAETLNEMFGQARAHDLAVCQPSLSLDSYYSHLMFLQCAGFKLRYTNYIEIMVPCLSLPLFEQVLPLFQDTMSGYGLDYLWCRLPGAGPKKAAVLDEISVHHTRPIGSQLRKSISDQKGETSEDEETRLLSKFGDIKKAVPVAYAGILSDGRPVEGRFKMAMAMHKGYGGRSEDFLDPTHAKRKMRQLFKRQLIKNMPLEILSSKAQ